MPYKALKTKAWLIIICAVLCAVCIIEAATFNNFWLMAASWLALAAIIVIAISILRKDTKQRHVFRQFWLSKSDGSPEQSLLARAWEIIVYSITCFSIMGILAWLHRPIVSSYSMMILVVLSAGRILYEISHCENSIAPSAKD